MSFPYRGLLSAAIVCVFLTGCSNAPQTAVAASGKTAPGKSAGRKDASRRMWLGGEEALQPRVLPVPTI